MPVLGVAEDGSWLQMRFNLSAGAPVTLRFQTEQIESFIGKASQMVNQARSRRSTTSGHLAIQPVAVEAAAAQSPVGGGRVVLSLRAANGVPYHFAIHEEESRSLRIQMEAAEESSRAQSQQGRH
jgi:hypothetical protein